MHTRGVLLLDVLCKLCWMAGVYDAVSKIRWRGTIDLLIAHGPPRSSRVGSSRSHETFTTTLDGFLMTLCKSMLTNLSRPVVCTLRHTQYAADMFRDDSLMLMHHSLTVTISSCAPLHQWICCCLIFSPGSHLRHPFMTWGSYCHSHVLS